MKNVDRLSDNALIDALIKAKELQLQSDFIHILEMEAGKRKNTPNHICKSYRDWDITKTSKKTPNITLPKRKKYT